LGLPFVKRFALSDRSLSVLQSPRKGHSPQFSAHICCGQMAGWIKMPLGRKLGLDPSDIVLDGDQVPVPHVYCGQTAAWIKIPLGMGVGLGAVLDGNLAPLPPKETQPLIFGPCLLCPRIWTYQDTTWYGGRTRLKRHCVRWGPSSLPQKGQSPQFSAHVYWGQTAAWINMPFGMQVALGPGHIVLDGDPAPPPQKGHSPQFSVRR